MPRPPARTSRASTSCRIPSNAGSLRGRRSWSRRRGRPSGRHAR
uniref:Uncharacterized protein n=1 Tax=Arundo donax TaxID=35708 RepID=A0A0A9FAZ8_ARUDO